MGLPVGLPDIVPRPAWAEDAARLLEAHGLRVRVWHTDVSVRCDGMPAGEGWIIRSLDKSETSFVVVAGVHEAWDRAVGWSRSDRGNTVVAAEMAIVRAIEKDILKPRHREGHPQAAASATDAR